MYDRVIGVLGGLGPEATVDFCFRIIGNTNAPTEQDHIRCIVDNNPKAPNRNHAIAGNGPSPAPAFEDSARMLERCGVDFIVMPCNTAHAFVDAILQSISIPFISMIDETCNHLSENHQNIEHIGLLAADGCLRANLYQTKLEESGFTVVLLNSTQQEAFMRTVYDIKQFGASKKSIKDMEDNAHTLISAGAEIILAGCTEIPLVLKPESISVPLVETTEILAKQSVRYAKRELDLP